MKVLYDKNNIFIINLQLDYKILIGIQQNIF